MSAKDENGLNAKERMFCDNFLIHGDAKRAMKEAGYAETTADAKCNSYIKRPHVSAYLTKKMNEMTSEKMASAEEVCQFLTDVMRGDVKDTLIMPDNKDVSGFREVGKTPQVRDRTKAAELLGKRYSIFTDVTKVEVAPIVIVDDMGGGPDDQGTD